MKRETVETVVVAVLCILALSVAAASLNTATGGGDGGGIIGAVAGWLPIPNIYAEQPTEPVGVETTDGDLEERLSPLQSLLCIPALRDPMVQLAIAGVVVVGGVVLVWWRDFVEVATAAAVMVTPGLLLVFLIDFALRGCTAETATPDSGGVGGLGGAAGGGDGTQVSVVTQTDALVLVVVAIGLVAAVVAIVGTSGDDDAAAGDEDDERLTRPAPMAAIADVAGAAADRIEASGEVDNEIYRAWRDMTAELDVSNPDASTPAEFREAAVAAGMAPADVDDLTELFETVRYGGGAVTAERERRAVEALRRIEEAYTTP